MAQDRDWRTEFMLSHTRLFDVVPDEPERSFGYPRCEAGWRDILDRLCFRIQSALKENEKFEFVRIKEKFGVLRIDWNGELSDETATSIHEAVNLATARSACTCDLCGAEGRLYSDDGWLATSCSEHAAGEAVAVRSGFENVRVMRRRPGSPDMYQARYDRETDSLIEVSSPSPDPEQ
ncbi:hypothetical protein GPL21_06955 [Bradyrhizobium pachyrhizi]|uniref:Uncharacterized protein n=1 Tax=Bradyrhizobium pachyrhizi TaxID=280333 RepID=A0A844SLN8_9BRAD|nr:hypothetical protein [Bradyrhizobium pachyrhizi]MVT64844.1 hypothetical protein [Bradyrhizobium pachyrhizi]